MCCVMSCLDARGFLFPLKLTQVSSYLCHFFDILHIFIINLAYDWLEKRIEAVFEPSLSLINGRSILSHLFGATQKR